MGQEPMGVYEFMVGQEEAGFGRRASNFEGAWLRCWAAGVELTRLWCPMGSGFRLYSEVGLSFTFSELEVSRWV